MLFDYYKDRRIQFMVLKASYIIQLKRKKNPHNPDFESESDSRSAVSLCDATDYTVHGILQARVLE